ncbi:MAG: serine/threonine-protein kinase [Myxococcaceae bacterium]
MAGYTLLKKVADGAAAEAYLARSETGFPVLLEVSRAEVVHDIELYGRFLDLAQGRKSFTHPNLLARTNTSCGDDGRVYVITEPIDGPTLAEHIQEKGPLELSKAVEWAIAVTSALGYLHSRGVVHGSLTPRHVYLAGKAEQPTPKLLETGLLLFRTNRSVKTPASLVLVRPEYLSPERAAGKRGDKLSDIYGMGVLLYEMLLGRPPFSGGMARQLHISTKPPELPFHLRAISPLLNCMLAKEPHQRPQSANELELELRDVLSALGGPDEIDIAIEAQAPISRPKLEVVSSDPSLEVIDSPTPDPAAPNKATPLNQAAASMLTPDSRDGLPTQSLKPPQDRPTPPPALLGPYQILRPLGEGGMGRVFLARHVHLDKEVAIKVLKPNFAEDPVATKRFLLEAKTANQVKNPHLLEVYDFLEDERGRFCCVMEPLKGETLRGRGSKEIFPINRVIKIARQVCEALTALHDAGVVHRDVKPDNVFLIERDGDRDYVKLFDLGIARVLHAQAGDDVNLTRARQVVGTPAYMAPEQAMVGPIDGRADLYALGTLIYVLLCGRFPFDAISSEQMMETKVRERPRALPSKAASGEEIPKALRRLVARCLEPAPSRRVSTAKELADELMPFEALQPALADTRRKRWPFALAGVAGLGVAGFLAWQAGLLTHATAAVQPQPVPQAAPATAPVSPAKLADTVEAEPVRVVAPVAPSELKPFPSPASQALKGAIERGAPVKKTTRRR